MSGQSNSKIRVHIGRHQSASPILENRLGDAMANSPPDPMRYPAILSEISDYVVKYCVEICHAPTNDELLNHVKRYTPHPKQQTAFFAYAHDFSGLFMEMDNGINQVIGKTCIQYVKPWNICGIVAAAILGTIGFSESNHPVLGALFGAGLMLLWKTMIWHGNYRQDVKDLKKIFFESHKYLIGSTLRVLNSYQVNP